MEPVESRMQKISAKWAKTKTLEAKDAPIDAQLLFIELKVDEREAFLCSLCYGLLNCLVSVQRQWKDPSISLSISTALTCTFHLVHRPHESDLALYCLPRKLQTTPLRLSDLIDLTFNLGMEGLLTDSETQSSDLDWHTGVQLVYQRIRRFRDKRDEVADPAILHKKDQFQRSVCKARWQGR